MPPMSARRSSLPLAALVPDRGDASDGQLVSSSGPLATNVAPGDARAHLQAVARWPLLAEIDQSLARQALPPEGHDERLRGPH